MAKRKDTHTVIPTKERCLQHGGVIQEAIAWDVHGKPLINRYRVVAECPLDSYREHNLISGTEHRAGLHFRHAYHKAVLSRSATLERLNRFPASTGLTMSEKLIKDAHRILPPHNMGVIIDVCGYGQHIWSQQALDSLRKGLGKLAIRWHMAAMEVCDHKKSET